MGCCCWLRRLCLVDRGVDRPVREPLLLHDTKGIGGVWPSCLSRTDLRQHPGVTSNDVNSSGKTYCDATAGRGGWEQVSC